MSDFKSKLPDLKELGSMGSKLFHGIKDAVVEIVDDYKKKRADKPDVKPTSSSTEDVTPAEKKPAPKRKTAAKKAE